jgi:hypothetical protein
LLGEGIGSGEVGYRSEGGEGVADAQHEVAVAEAPEVLGVIVQMPGGSGEDATGGEFEENGIYDTVLVVFGLVGEAGDEAMSDEGEEKMFVINVVQREHRAAVEQKLRAERLEAEILQGDAQRELGSAGGGKSRE